MNYWLLVTHPKNFEAMKAKNLAAMKAKRKNFAEKVEVGDKVIFYLTKIGRFGGVAEFKSKAKFDETKMFVEEKPGSSFAKASKDKETHPWRFGVKFEVMLDEGDYVPSENFKDKLKYLKRWPAKYWKLGFQGNVHEIPREDYETLKKGLLHASS